MLDLRFIRENPDVVKKSCKDRGYDCDIDTLLKLDLQWRSMKQESDFLRSKRNKISEEINALKKEGKSAEAKLREAKGIPSKIERIEADMKKIDEQLKNILQRIPNIQDKSVPVGTAEVNKVIREHGSLPKFPFPVKPHWEIGAELGILDLEAAAKIAGAGFYVLKGKGAALQRALVQFMIDFHVKDGFVEINPPNLVNYQTAFGTGNLPKFEQDLYKAGEMYLIPTAEVPVTNLYADEVLEGAELPKKFVAFTQCFRTEAGKHGTETRGIYRLHQFEKVEMVYMCKQEDSFYMLEEMRARAEKLLESLKLPFRTLLLATGDAGFASAKTYDIESWSPYQKKYLEVSSCSNCTDFQARRMNTRYKTKDGARFIHTLNGSGLALPRLLISILENYQQKDGSVLVPDVLHKYTGFDRIEKQ